ncbi:MAG TPA: hypothetical protein VGM39_02610, partial [Kofleriaceae bacterium]
SPESLDVALRDLRRQLMEARGDAFRHGLGGMIEKLDRVETRLSEAERDIDAAHGGDADAAQRARRALLDIDATMAEADLAKKWPELDDAARRAAINASSSVGMHGTDAERALLGEVLQAMDKARKEKDGPELERQMRLAQRLSAAAFNRTTEAWEYYFSDAASEVSRAKDLPRAQKLVQDGKAAMARGDNEELRRIVKALWNLLPEDSDARKKGFDSGVRYWVLRRSRCSRRIRSSSSASGQTRAGSSWSARRRSCSACSSSASRTRACTTRRSVRANGRPSSCVQPLQRYAIRIAASSRSSGRAMRHRCAPPMIRATNQTKKLRD